MRLFRNSLFRSLQFILIVTFGILLSEYESEGKDTNATIEKAFISFRIGSPQWISEDRFNELLELFEKYKGVTDEITLFHSYTHAPLPLDEVKRRSAILADRMKRARGFGYKTGVNILTTIGHGGEDLANSLTGNFTPVTNIDGEVCPGSFCPNDENMRDYIRQLYDFVASANPDYIWIDDDVRFGHMPVNLTCFCDNCLAVFEKETGVKYTRQTLKTALNEGALESKLHLRKAWLRHNRKTIARLFELIEQTVHRLKPGMPLGFMTGDRFFEGYDFDTWADILSGPDNADVWWRPGGGFYTDGNTSGLAGKSHQIGRQVSVLPDRVQSIQSEIENFTYQRLEKAVNITVLEAASHIAAGCTGAAFNVLSMYDEPLTEYEPLIAGLKDARPFFNLLAKTVGRKKTAGIFPAWSKDFAASCNISDGDWFRPNYGRFLDGLAPELCETGLPCCYSSEYASVTLLSEDNVLALTEDEILKILSKGVYMDVPALVRLNNMGYRDLTGFSVLRGGIVDSKEKFTGHPLNGEFSGRVRDGRQYHYGWPAYTLTELDEKAETLSGLIDYNDTEIGACSMGIFENRIGGRICVAGYFPWTSLHNLSKSTQMKSIMRWLSKDRLPAYINSYHKINVWIREPVSGQCALTLTNSSFDTARDIRLMLLTDKKEIRIFDMNCNEIIVRAGSSEGNYNEFTIPEIEPWRMRLVVTGL